MQFTTIVALSLAWLVATAIIPGITITNTTHVLVAGLVLALLNSFVRPLLVLLTLPLTILTLGLFLLVINTTLVGLTAWLLPSLTISSVWSAFLASLLMTITTLVFKKSNKK